MIPEKWYGKSKFTNIGGFYTSGILNGRGKVEYQSGLVIEGLFLNGYLEGCVVGKCMRGEGGTPRPAPRVEK